MSQSIAFLAKRLACIIITTFFICRAASYGQEITYPEEVTRLIKEANIKLVCETSEPRKVGTILYKNKRADWVLRVFTKEGKELEVWLNYKTGFLSAYFPDKVFYLKDQNGWVDKDSISAKEAKRLDKQLKFSQEEINFFQTCLDKKSKEK